MNINIIVAFCKNYGIGIENRLPWKIISDLKKFKNLTLGNNNNAIIMGKNTYNSIKYKPLKNRDNLILSKTLNIDQLNGTNNIVKSFNNIEKLEDFVKTKKYNEIWIIGGQEIYELFMNKYDNNSLLKPNKIYVTYIDKEIKCDTFFPKIDSNVYRFISQELHQTHEEIYDFVILDRVYKRI